LIMRGTTPRSLSWRGLLAVLSLGGMLLPLLPTWAQEKPPSIKLELEIVKDLKPGDAADLAKARAEIQRLRAELEKKLAEAGAMELRLREATKKVTDAEKHELENRLGGALKQLTDAEAAVRAQAARKLALETANPQPSTVLRSRQGVLVQPAPAKPADWIILREVDGKWLQVDPAKGNKDTLWKVVPVEPAKGSNAFWKVEPAAEKKGAPQNPAEAALRQKARVELLNQLVEIKPAGAKKQDRIIHLELQGAQDKTPKTVYLREIDGKWVQVEPPKEAQEMKKVERPSIQLQINPTTPPGAPKEAKVIERTLARRVEMKRLPLAPPGGDNRIEQLERKLESVLKELEALRKDLQKKPAPKP